MATKTDKSLLFDINGKLPPLRYSMPMAVQHLFAMIVGSVTPAIILSALAGMSQDQSVLLIQSSLVTAVRANRKGKIRVSRKGTMNSQEKRDIKPY